ncbi:glycoside hydrolase superfamily [Myxozyma melibiosi]|uniref:beta-glucosidase n=1 Tax=Myxozyma melibiosi TaxID=54550 RepID=A0ABR1F3Y4_9ASCO
MIADFDVEKVIEQLTTDEKIALLSGADNWHTFKVPRLGVPAIRVTDGPNGVRGTRFFNGTAAACFPCGTALASTWNTDLLEKGGVLMGREAIAKSAHVILGPTVNIQRGPLGGRGFESFSEDPLLSGLCASAIINGIQRTGVVATIKHFVNNDQEHERKAVNVILSQRALREIYLMPFQIAISNSNPGAVMSSYNKVNGCHVSHNPYLLDDILRKEWKYDGLIMSDWHGVYSVADSINAGLDLEMPGPALFRGDLVNRDLNARTVTMRTIDERARNVLNLVKRVQVLDIEPEGPESTRNNTPETAALLRQIAQESIVVLKNENSLLPLSKTKTTAVIGPNAKVARFCGGGSASLEPYYAVTPYDGIAEKLKLEKPTYVEGAPVYKSIPPLGKHNCKTPSGQPGLRFRSYREPDSVKDRKPVDERTLASGDVFLSDYEHPSIIDLRVFYAEFIGIFTPEESGEYEFGLAVYGTAKLYIDDELFIDNATKQIQGSAFFGYSTREEIKRTELIGGKSYTIRVDFGSAMSSTLPSITGDVPGGGLKLGVVKVNDPNIEIQKAIEAAADADQVVVCIGLNGEFESEGFDRPDMLLPGNTDKLVSAVLAANPNTVVVVQSGCPVEMPWAKEARSIVQAWYGGNETGSSIADIIFGDANPSGKLSLSFPAHNEDNPTYLSFRSDRGRVLYGEDVYVGYRYYETAKKSVLFPFGHGLSYSDFKFSDLTVAIDGEDVVVSLTVTNCKGPEGSAVVQVYVSQQHATISRPLKELKGFAKVFVKAGESEAAKIKFSVKSATSFFDEIEDKWISEKDTYTVHVGDSSASIQLTGEFSTEKTLYWSGL